jgi:hypothetical protein
MSDKNSPFLIMIITIIIKLIAFKKSPAVVGAKQRFACGRYGLIKTISHLLKWKKIKFAVQQFYSLTLFTGLPESFSDRPAACRG